jgi:hypothetical protein
VAIVAHKSTNGVPRQCGLDMPAIYRSIMPEALDAWDYLQKTTFEEPIC